jgi:Domain of unknown function (DUF4149)
MKWSEPLRRLLPGLWLGWTLCVALLAAPAPFALLAAADAGRVAARMLAQEAYTAVVVGTLLLLLERLAARRAAATDHATQFSAGMVLVLGALFCTLAGYFAVQPMMASARLGQGALSFGQLHAVSAGFFVLKTVLIAALAWRAVR